MICANDVSNDDIGFNTDDNKLTIITTDGQVNELEKASKQSLSNKLIQLIANHLEEKV